MRFTRIVALFLTLAVPCGAYTQQSKKPRPNSRTTAAPQTPRPRPSLSPVPPQMTPEKAFYYFVAMYGFGKVLRYGGPDDAIEIYGKAFDAGNYERAMADEFERNRYKERIRARIADEVRKIDFSEKFTFVAQATLGEYSFGSHSFPFVWDMFQQYRFCVGPRYDIGTRDCRFLDVTGFRVRDAVNGNDFNWSVPMSETDASAFVKSRSTEGTGKVDRRIAVRITYSVVNKQEQEPGTNFIGEYSHPIFSPFIYSVEAYNDKSLTAKLGVIPKINSLGPSTAEELRLATVAAQTATHELGKYRYIASYQDGQFRRPDTPFFGTITLTDVGVTLSGEKPDGSSQMQSFSFLDSPAAILWRANSQDDARGKKDFRVVWQPFWKQDYNSALRFETLQERDRFFVDLTRALQEWKTKYASFQFAAGKVSIDQRCEVNTRLIPCSKSTPFEVPFVEALKNEFTMGNNAAEVTTSSGLKYIDLVKGTGDSPKLGQTATVHYTAALEDGTELYNSYDKDQPFNFTIEPGKIIKGLEEGLITMKVGGKRKLIIPPSLSYGQRGRPPRIPPNATLIFEVELLGIK